MKILLELVKCPKCKMMHCTCGTHNACGICHHDPCICKDQYDTIEYDRTKISIGKHSDESDGQFDPDELAMGIEDELKHVNKKSIAKRIAKDHLIQNPRYYSITRALKITESFIPFLLKEHTLSPEILQHELYVQFISKSKLSDYTANALSIILTQLPLVLHNLFSSRSEVDFSNTMDFYSKLLLLLDGKIPLIENILISINRMHSSPEGYSQPYWSKFLKTLHEILDSKYPWFCKYKPLLIALEK